MAMIKLGELLDLIDVNRSGQEAVLICDNGNDVRSRVFTDALMLEQIEDVEVNSIGADGDEIVIWLENRSVEEHRK